MKACLRVLQESRSELLGCEFIGKKNLPILVPILFSVGAHQFRLRDDMSPYGYFQSCLGRFMQVVEYCIQSVQLMKIAMATNGRTRASITGSFPVIKTFFCTRRQASSLKTFSIRSSHREGILPLINDRLGHF